MVFILLGAPNWAARKPMRTGDEQDISDGLSTVGSQEAANAQRGARAGSTTSGKLATKSAQFRWSRKGRARSEHEHGRDLALPARAPSGRRPVPGAGLQIFDQAGLRCERAPARIEHRHHARGREAGPRLPLTLGPRGRNDPEKRFSVTPALLRELDPRWLGADWRGGEMRRLFLAVSALLFAAVTHVSRAQTLPELFGKVKAEVKSESWAEALKTLDALEAEAAKPGNESAQAQLAGPARLLQGRLFRQPRQGGRGRGRLRRLPQAAARRGHRLDRLLEESRRGIREGPEAARRARAHPRPKPTRTFGRRPTRKTAIPPTSTGPRGRCAGS